MNERDLQKDYIYHIHPGEYKITTVRRFVNIDKGSMGGTHWTHFYIKHDKLFQFDSFGGQFDNFSVQQLPELDLKKIIDMVKQYKIKNLPDPISIKEAASKLYVDKKFSDPSIRKHSAHVDVNDRNLNNVKFVKILNLPVGRDHLTPKISVHNAVEGFTLVRTYRTNYFNRISLINFLCSILISEPNNFNHAATKGYVDNTIDVTSLVKINESVNFGNISVSNI